MLLEITHAVGHASIDIDWIINDLPSGINHSPDRSFVNLEEF